MIKKIFAALLLSTVVSFSQTEKSSMSDLLASASLISVSIGGNFPVTGSYPASVNERVDQFVTRIYDKAFSSALGNSPSRRKSHNCKKPISSIFTQKCFIEEKKW